MGPQAGKTIASGHYGGAGGILPEGRDHSSGGKRRASVVGQLLTAGSYAWKRSTLLSILLGTGAYMLALRLL